MSAWKLGRRHPVCAACEREFAEGERHYSSLDLDGEDVARVDLCDACFQARAEPPALFWRAVHRPAKKRGLAIDVEALEGFFRMLAPREEPRWQELRYVLALLLMRKRRLLLVRAVRRAEGEALVVRRPRRQEEETVPVFDLDPEAIEGLRVQLEALFEGEGLEGSETEGEAATDESADEPAEAEPARD